MNRKTRQRRIRRRQRQVEPEVILKETGVNNVRLRQLFANMSFGSHEKDGTKPFRDYSHGPSVQASTPEELAAKTNEFFVDEALKQPKN